MDAGSILHVSIRSRLEDVGFLTQLLVDAAGQAIQADWILLEIGLAEVVNNAIKYAAGGLPDGHVTLKADIREGQLVVEVEDNGLPMPSDTQSAFERAGDMSDVMALSGRGFSLVRHCFSDARFRNEDGVNRVTLYYPLAQETAPL
ncbi:ATP-binding protein [Nitrospirillum amazonense]|uniref:Anti-sigma regulatory factor (Ser/Thr protein kinase) n=1 Tax=Nitrospirillum amazonense TaxID=28077 RepID=A0A560J567_9PROT|nr:ATP-binding protein [Nitrospirillum amazonense]MDG3439577.1 ATP-binding protein [Nitrospirillum amazonense]TWB65975.1 anti-sigma regulatory factor (Ser/Thr protein kinase) [Nitrospirillum amazonense]